MKDNLSGGVSGDGPHDEVFNVAVEGLFDACGHVLNPGLDSNEWASHDNFGVALASLPLEFRLDELSG